MQGLRWVQMSESELNEFLGDGGTGTISFSTPVSDPPFSLPVSYGYDTDTESFYFRLSFSSDSGKADFLDNHVTFVVHDRTDDGWRSVVAKGRLEEVTEMPYDSSVVQAMWAVDIPEVDVFEQPPDEVDFRQFRLAPDDVTGRKEVQKED